MSRYRAALQCDAFVQSRDRGRSAFFAFRKRIVSMVAYYGYLLKVPGKRRRRANHRELRRQSSRHLRYDDGRLRRDAA